MAKALINGDIITWARHRAEIAPEDLALSLLIKPEQLDLWERGEKYPTFRQAQNIAKKLHIPFGYLFLSDPPVLETRIADLRTIGSEERNHYSPEFEDVLSDAQIKQNWYREQLLKEGATELAFIGQFSVNDDPKDVAHDIQDTLGLNQEFRLSCNSSDNFLSKFIEIIEAAGILVLRNGVVRNNNRRKLSVSEFRGFVLSDTLAPLIFINNNDTKAAKIFTLAHELAHLWIGESGVSNNDPASRLRSRTNEIERFCNKVAAEVLVPEEEFLDIWDDAAELQENLRNVSRRFRVSKPVTLIRARSLGKISNSFFSSEYPKYNKARKSSASSGGDFNNTLPVRNSKTLTRAIITSALEGSTLYHEAAKLLGVKVSTLNSLATSLEIR